MRNYKIKTEKIFCLMKRVRVNEDEPDAYS
jgi:hypothetical protein